MAHEKARLTVIDLARGIAALCVLVYHYQHFLFRGTAGISAAEVRTLPLHDVLWPLYEHGHYAVQFFWLLSGFVFCAAYRGSGIGVRDFALHRFARLYPLHVVTLLVVAVLQAISSASVGHWQIYGNNDWPHFALQLLFASNWLASSGFSFNAPVWSVSVEVCIYAVFLLSLPALQRYGWRASVPVALLMFVLWRGHAPFPWFTECALYFYTGVASYDAYRNASARGLALAGAALLPWCIPSFLVGSLLIVCAVERVWQVPRGWRWIGDNTYGTYLWHVPLQIAALTVLDSCANDRAVVLSPWMLGAFIVGVSVLARCSFVWFERPAQQMLRRRSAGSLHAEPRPP